MPALVTQSHAHAGGDIAAGDIHKTVNYNFHQNAYEAIEKLSQKLKIEIQERRKQEGLIDSFAYYNKRKTPSDGIIGLQAVLEASNRGDFWEDALDLKVEFERLVEEWSMYASAQEIFAHILGKIENTFKRQAKPQFVGTPVHIDDTLVDKIVIEPIVNECGNVDHFVINWNRALGMLYWLADRCFIKWHK